jgi:hypothetical protein
MPSQWRPVSLPTTFGPSAASLRAASAEVSPAGVLVMPHDGFGIVKRGLVGGEETVLPSLQANLTISSPGRRDDE